MKQTSQIRPIDPKKKTRQNSLEMHVLYVCTNQSACTGQIPNPVSLLKKELYHKTDFCIPRRRISVCCTLPVSTRHPVDKRNVCSALLTGMQ